MAQVINGWECFPRGWETPVSSIIRDDFVTQDDIVSYRTGMGRHNF
ncbi:hypothetical protein MY11210_004230, partial [Beauveria gryllotalpidicola]